MQVALHPIGRGEIDLFITPVKEVPYPCMLQIGIHDTGQRDIPAVGLVGYQATDATDDQIDLHPCLAGAVERIDHPLVLETVHL